MKAKPMKRIPVDVTEEEHKAIKEYVRSRGMTIAGLVRMLVHRELAAHEQRKAVVQ